MSEPETKKIMGKTMVIQNDHNGSRALNIDQINQQILDVETKIQNLKSRSSDMNIDPPKTILGGLKKQLEHLKSQKLAIENNS